MGLDNGGEEESPLIYGLELQARALASQSAMDSTLVRFLVGTQSLKSENQIHLLEYLEESHSLSKAIFKHPGGEIWDMTTSLRNPNLVVTSYSSPSPTHEGRVRTHCSLWKFPIDISNNLVDEDNVSSQGLEKLADFDATGAGAGTGVGIIGKAAFWRPEEGNQVANFDEDKIHLWDVETHQLISSFSVDPSGSGSKGSSKVNKVTNLRWSPHSNCGVLGVAIGTSVYGKDMRTKTSGSNYVWHINAHSHLVRDLDFNPNAQYYLATCGDDCESRFWDIRNPGSPAVSLLNHSHWVWSIRYNNFHDQLVLTCSSDSRVILSRVATLASQPFGHLLEGEDIDDLSLDEQHFLNKSNSSGSRLTDGVVATFEEHEDSVYSAEWSSSDPWIFASLSYDGRLVINKVPKSEKFNILF